MENTRQKVLIIGGSGFFGRRMLELAPLDRCEVHSTGATRSTGVDGVREYLLDVTDIGAMRNLLDEVEPDAVVFLAKSPRFNDQPDVSESVFLELARMIGDLNIRLVFYSTDSVFDGKKGMYSEDDHPNPINAYGRWKLRAEEILREALPSAIIVRTSYIYGRNGEGLDRRSREVLDAVRSGQSIERSAVMYRSFTWVDDLAYATWKLLETGYAGTLHLAGPRMSLFEFYRTLVSAFGENPEAVISQSENGLPADVPRDTSLDSMRAGQILGFIPSEISRF